MHSTARAKKETFERNSSHGVSFSTTRIDEISENSMIRAPNISRAPIGRSHLYSVTWDCPARKIPRNTLTTAHSAEVNAIRIGCFGTSVDMLATAVSGRKMKFRQK